MQTARYGRLPAPALACALACALFASTGVGSGTGLGPRPAAAQTTSAADRKAGEALVARWLEAQNQRNFDAYQALYAQRFTGVKRVGKATKTLDRTAWLKDRKAMFKADQRVTVSEQTFARSGQTLVIELTQRWEQGSFADVGRKRLVLDLRPSAGPILAEEMLSSRVVPSTETCVRALLPRARRGTLDGTAASARIRDVLIYDVGTDLHLCQVMHQVRGDRTTTHELGVIKRGKGWTLMGERLTHVVQTEPELGGSDEEIKTGKISISVVPIRKTESAALVELKETTAGPMLDAGVARSQLMRLTSTGLEELLAFESKWDNGESTSETRCELARGSGVHGGFFDQEVECTTAVGSWHDEDPADRGEQRTAEQKRYRWNGRAYEE